MQLRSVGFLTEIVEGSSMMEVELTFRLSSVFFHAAGPDWTKHVCSVDMELLYSHSSNNHKLPNKGELFFS